MPMPTACQSGAEAAGGVRDRGVKRGEDGARPGRGEHWTDPGLGQREGVEAPDDGCGDHGRDGRERQQHRPEARGPQCLTAHRQRVQELEPAGPSSPAVRAVAPAMATPDRSAGRNSA